MMNNPLVELFKAGQSVWLDNLERSFVQSGELSKLIRADGIRGITSNPAIFHKAITGSKAYDSDIQRLSKEGRKAVEIYEHLAISDIRLAADALRDVYESSEGDDGFVSLEVSPHLALDPTGTIQEAKRLWKAVDRPNLMIKIPGTQECLSAIEEVLFSGINVNVTLLFSLQAYRDVILAHQKACSRREAEGLSVKTVASVASFFLSRIDTMIDPLLDEYLKAHPNKEKAAHLRGKAAVASAKLAYQLWQNMYDQPDWKALEKKGARKQKPLWASTSTKDPAYSDVKYVEALIGPSTINTMPDETVRAFRDHGRVDRTIDQYISQEREFLEGLEACGISLKAITDQLVREGIEKFVKPFDSLLTDLESKRRRFLEG